jgi:putative transcriptional regulator
MKIAHESRADALTDEQIHAAALADPDAQPLTPERLAGMRQTPRLKIIRRALGLTQEQFAARFHIPLGTLRDWEQGASQPDQTARAYLRAIAGDAGAVQRALETVPFVSFMECLSVDGLDLNRDRDTGRDVAL